MASGNKQRRSKVRDKVPCRHYAWLDHRATRAGRGSCCRYADDSGLKLRDPPARRGGGAYTYLPSALNWSFSGSSGIEADYSVECRTADGYQAAFLQSGGGNAQYPNGGISQMLAFVHHGQLPAAIRVVTAQLELGKSKRGRLPRRHAAQYRHAQQFEQLERLSKRAEHHQHR